MTFNSPSNTIGSNAAKLGAILHVADMRNGPTFLAQ